MIDPESRACRRRIGCGPGRILKLVLCIFALAFSGYAYAGPTKRVIPLNAEGGPDSLFRRGRIPIQLNSGVLVSPFIFERHRPDLDLFQTNLRLGWFLTEPGPERSIFRGCHELILEITHGAVISGAGNYISGITPLGRYSFVQPDARLIPYVQGGVGVVYTDAHKDRSQDMIGQAVEFTPQFSVGMQYLVGGEWSIDLEAKFEHISNAGMSSRNEGVNAGGVFLGMTYFWDRCGRPMDRP